MSLSHAKHTVLKLNAVDLSNYANNSQKEFTADSHDVTTYGKNSHVYAGGLKGGTATFSGFYDTTADTGPRDAIQPLLGTVVEFIHQPEGAGVGKPQDKVDVLVVKYTETSPVADYVQFAVDLQFSDDVDSTPQSA